MKKHTLGRSLLGVTALTTTLAASMIVAIPASAAELIPGNEINGGAYTITLNPTTRSPIGLDPEWDPPALQLGPLSVNISTGCPVGYRVESRSFIVSPSGVETPAALARENVNADLWGLQGKPITLLGEQAASWGLLNAESLPTGLNRLVITCDAVGRGPWDPNVIGDSKYFVAYIQVDRAADTWTVVDKPSVAKTATTTALAASGTTAGSTTLTATVAPAAATGTVTFKQDGTVIGSPVAVTGGTAGLTVTGLTPNSAQSFTAEYSGDTTHEASTGAVSVNTLPAPDGSESEVNVSVPAPESNDPTGLKISVKPSAVTLSGAAARSAGSPWTATGSLGNVTVNDDRREVSAQGWTLSGKAVDFTGSGTAAGASIAASNLAWSPAKVSGAGTQGSASNDLSASRTLATGTASGSSNVQTTVSAGLSLTVPADKQAGAYQSKITLILI